MNFPMPTTTQEFPPGAHITFPEVSWHPAQSEALDTLPVAPGPLQEPDLRSPVAKGVEPGTLVLLGIMALCFVAVLVQAATATGVKW
jgi:hypothetical protein